MRDRHKVTESAVDNDNGNDEDNDNDNIDGKESIKSILRTVILKVNRRESEDLTERILKDLKPQFLGSLIKFRLIYKDVNNVEDKTLSLLKSTLDGIDIDSAPNLYDILSVSIIEDMMSVEAADVESAVEKLAAIDNITTEDVERHFENKTNMAEIYRVLLEKYGKGIEEYRVLSSQNNSFSK